MKISTLIIISVVILSSFACKEDKDSKPGGESPSSDQYEEVQGIVLKVVAASQDQSPSKNPISDIYYVYNLDQAEPIIGVEKNSELKFAEDDLVKVSVNKKNQNLSSIDKRGMVDQELLYQYLKRTDSSYYRMKDRVPFN